MKCDSCNRTAIACEITVHSGMHITSKLPNYINIGETCFDNGTEIRIKEPVMTNPNSYENLLRFLENIKARYIDDERKWLSVGADGPPYCIMRRIIEDYPEEFDGLAIVSGKGHLYINQLKTYFKILENIMTKA